MIGSREAGAWRGAAVGWPRLQLAPTRAHAGSPPPWRQRAPQLSLKPPHLPHPPTLPLTHPSPQLGGNRIASFEAVLPALARLPSLSCLYLEGNPLARDFEYRMRTARALPALAQLDATPVLRRD